jgi:hypothetical protein
MVSIGDNLTSPCVHVRTTTAGSRPMCSLQELEIPALELTFAQPDPSYLQPAFNNSGGRGKIGPDQFQFLLLICWQNRPNSIEVGRIGRICRISQKSDEFVNLADNTTCQASITVKSCLSINNRVAPRVF